MGLGTLLSPLLPKRKMEESTVDAKLILGYRRQLQKVIEQQWKGELDYGPPEVVKKLIRQLEGSLQEEDWRKIDAPWGGYAQWRNWMLRHDLRDDWPYLEEEYKRMISKISDLELLMNRCRFKKFRLFLKEEGLS
jgi:hypothetical protein